MENLIDEQLRMEKARKKVKAIKGFYRHLGVYILVNLFLLTLNFIDLGAGENFFKWGNFSTPLFWGIGLLFHGFSVFGTDVFLGRGWEDRKMNELMEKDANHKSKWE